MKFLSFNSSSFIKTGLTAMGKFLEIKTKKNIAQLSRGRVYRVRIGGSIVDHIASKPYYPPNKMRGNLRKSITVKISGYKILFTAGGSNNVTYAKFLELGTKRIKPRPNYKKTADLVMKKISKFIPNINNYLK